MPFLKDHQRPGKETGGVGDKRKNQYLEESGRLSLRFQLKLVWNSRIDDILLIKIKKVFFWFLTIEKL